MEGRYPPGLWITLMDCTETAKEDEFNQWYDEVFIPGLKDLDFIQNNMRYENVLSLSPTFQGRPKYFTLWEVYHHNLEQALKDIHEREGEIIREKKDSSVFIAKINTLYRLVGPEFRSERSGRPIQAVYCGLLGCADPAREDEFNKWYNERHAPETINNDIFSFDTGYRYQVVDPHDPTPHQSSPYLTIYETSANPTDALQGLSALRGHSLAVWDTLWIELLRVYFAALFKPMNP